MPKKRVFLFYRWSFLLIILSIPSISFAQRTVFDNDRGNYYQYPYNMDWSAYGAYGGQPRQTNNSIVNHGIWYQMKEGTVKSTHARFQHFSATDKIVNNFPFQDFTNYVKDEENQKRISLWVSKTIGTYKSPVYFSYNEKLDDSLKVVHFSDRRYVKYFANEFCRAILQGVISYGNPVDEAFGPTWKDLIVGIDNYSWDYKNYGYVSSSGVFSQHGTGFTWDSPYPQNINELKNAIASFQSQLKKYAPDVPLMFNGQGIKDTTTYDQLFENMAGSFVEGFMSYFQQGYYDRKAIYWQLQTVKWMDKHDKITIFQGNLLDFVNSSMPEYMDIVRTMTCAYMIARGQNSFFGLGRDTANDYSLREILPVNYQYIKDWMGLPQSPFSLTLNNNDIAYGLYKRKYDGGWVYLNLTGVSKTINLEGTFYDRNGTAITSITIPDFRGDIIRNTSLPRPAMVSINNRYAIDIPISGSVSVQMSCLTPGTTIRYTLDGAIPDTSSLLYTTPIVLSDYTIVKAVAFKAGYDPSFVNTAVYNITTALPTVSFHLASDTISEFLKNGYALVKLNTLSSSSVKVNFSVSGSATNNSDFKLTDGTIEFKSFERYRVVRIPVIDDKIIEPLENIRLTLSTPVGATMGSQTTFDYYILDNDGVISGLPSDSNQLSKIIVFPNPASDKLNIKGILNEYATYQITNIEGKVLQSGELSNSSISVSFLQKGFYLIKIQTHSVEVVQRFIIE